MLNIVLLVFGWTLQSNVQDVNVQDYQTFGLNRDLKNTKWNLRGLSIVECVCEESVQEGEIDKGESASQPTDLCHDGA